MRKYGATVDNLLSVDLVTADGELVTASENENPDLFWGVRGGGGNFGIVTSFEYRLHPVGPIVLAGPIFHPLEDAPEVLRFYREFAAAAPDELTTILELELAPPLPFLPEDVHGKPIVMVGACYAGPPEDGAEVVRPLKEFGSPIVDRLEPKPYLALQSMFDPLVPHGWHRYWKSVELPPLTDGAIDTLIDHTSRITSPRSYTIILQLGGALGRVPEDATAFSQRDATHNVVINAVWTEDDPDGRPAHRLGARLLRRPAAPCARPRLRQLPRRRGTRPRSTGLRHREVRPAGRAQTQVRPHELLPPQPEHPAAGRGPAQVTALPLRTRGRVTPPPPPRDGRHDGAWSPEDATRTPHRPFHRGWRCRSPGCRTSIPSSSPVHRTSCTCNAKGIGRGHGLVLRSYRAHRPRCANARRLRDNSRRNASTKEVSDVQISNRPGPVVAALWYRLRGYVSSRRGR